jgi:cytochrome c-type biogenesis protein CcsB
MSASTPGLVRAIRFLGKVEFTMALLVAGSIIMTVGTILESRESREVAQALVYRTFWFDLLLFLIGVNLVVAVLNRVPIKRSQWPFVLTHFSIVALLIGCWISHTFGYEGRLIVHEGQVSDRIHLDTTEIRAAWRSDESPASEARFRLAEGISAAGRALQAEAADRPGLRIAEHLPDALARVSLREGGPDDAPGVEVIVSDTRRVVRQWLVAGDPETERKSLGRFGIELRVAASTEELAALTEVEAKGPGATLVVQTDAGGPPVRIPLPESVGREIQLGNGLVAEVAQFLLRARMVRGKLVDLANAEVNPAAVVEFRSNGRSEQRILFSRFPDFGSTHRPPGEEPLVQDAKLEGPSALPDPRAIIVLGPEEQLQVQLVSPVRSDPPVPLEPGRAVPLGSFGLSLEVERILPRARAELDVRALAPHESGGRPFVRVEVSSNGAEESVWLGLGGSEQRTIDGRSIELDYGRETRQVPFAIALREFEVVHYPGSQRPAEYRSSVEVRPASAGLPPRLEVISMNRPLDEQGFRLFQSSYIAGEGDAPDATILTVSYDPGVSVVYTSFVLLVLGIAWYVRSHGNRVKRISGREENPPTPRPRAPGRPGASSPRRAARIKSAAPGLLLALLVGLGQLALPLPGGASVHPLPFEETRGWAIQADGRVKPLATYANETALAVTGRRGIDGLSPLELFWGYVLAPTDFANRPYVRVDSIELKATLGLDPAARRYSFAELIENENFRPLADAALRRQQADEELNRLEKDVLDTYSKLVRVSGLTDWDALAMVPLTDASGAWTSPKRFKDAADPAQKAIFDDLMRMSKAYAGGDPDAFRAAAASLHAAIRSANPAAYPSESTIDRELFYEDLNAFGKAWKLYLLGSLLLLLVGIGLRWAIAGRAPVSNMYESLVFMGWGVIAFGLLQELIYRRRFLALAGGLMGFVCLAFSENLPIDSAINPLVPVLAHTSWLAIHVMTVMLSYSALALAMALGHFALIVQMYRPGRTELIRSISLLLYNTLQVGILFLAAGIICGAVWANESWGRYWGWDPKETWSLITFFIYLIIIHARHAGWMHETGLAASSILGFLAVIMTYYGVNYILAAGLHSYGFSEGGQGYAAAFAAFELAFVGFALFRQHELKRIAPTLGGEATG